MYELSQENEQLRISQMTQILFPKDGCNNVSQPMGSSRSLLFPHQEIGSLSCTVKSGQVFVATLARRMIP